MLHQYVWIVDKEDYVFENGEYKYMPSLTGEDMDVRYVLDGNTHFDHWGNKEPFSPLPQTFWGVDEDRGKAYSDCKQLCAFINERMGHTEAWTMDRASHWAGLTGKKK